MDYMCMIFINQALDFYLWIENYMKKISCFIFLFLAMFSGYSNANGQVKINDSMQAAYQNNSTILVFRQELELVKQEISLSMSGWKPNVEMNLSIVKSDMDGSAFGDSADGSVEKNFAFDLEQPLYRGGRTVASISSSNYLVKAQEQKLKLVEQQILLEAVRVHMDVVKDQKLLDLAIENRAIIKEQLEATNDRFAVGENTITDVKQSEARLAEAEADIIRKRGDLDISKSLYRRVTSMDAVNLSGDMALLPYEINLTNDIEFALNNSPEVLVVNYMKKFDESNVSKVYGELLPEISVVAGYNKKYDPQPGIISDSSDKSIGIYTRIPVFSAGNVRSRIAKSKKMVDKRSSELKEVRDDVEDLIISSWNKFNSAGAEIVARKTQVDAALLAKNGVYEEAVLGKRSVLDALDADKELIDAKVKLIIAQRNKVISFYSYIHALGLINI